MKLATKDIISPGMANGRPPTAAEWHAYYRQERARYEEKVARRYGEGFVSLIRARKTAILKSLVETQAQLINLLINRMKG